MRINEIINWAMLSLCNTNFSGLKLSEMYGNLCWEFTVGSSLGLELVGARWFYSVRMCKGLQRVSSHGYFYISRLFFRSAPNGLRKKRGHLNSSDDKSIIDIFKLTFYWTMAQFQPVFSSNRVYDNVLGSPQFSAYLISNMIRANL